MGSDEEAEPEACRFFFFCHNVFYGYANDFTEDSWPEWIVSVTSFAEGAVSKVCLKPVLIVI